MKILVTGGAGFIGGHLAASLNDAGHTVILCDLPGKFSDQTKKEYQCVECDISEKANIPQLPVVDVVYHLASHLGTASAVKNLNRDLLWNANGTLNISQYVIDNNIKLFCFTSSMAVYGNAEKAKETHTPKPTSPYGISKLCAEQYVEYVSRKSPQTRCVTFRVFNCYGPGQDTKNLTQGLASIFLQQMKNGNMIEVTGSLDRERDLIYIDDVVSALQMILNTTSMEGTYNLCSNESSSISRLIDVIYETSGLDYGVVEKKNIGGMMEDPFITTGDNQKLVNHGWKPKTNLKEGLLKCWKANQE
jgi:UDP-glucose 4-epimerase